MLRTTITKIKRVCVLAFIPRILRGDITQVPGQFEKFTISPIRNLKRGPEGEEERCRICERCRQLIEMAFGPEKVIEEKSEKIITRVVEEPDITQEINSDKLAHMVAPHIHVKPETETEKCARIIEQVFGKADEKKDAVEHVNSMPIENVRLQSTKVSEKLKDLSSGESNIAELQIPAKNKVTEEHVTYVSSSDDELLIAMRRNVDAYDNPTENTSESRVYATTAKENDEKLIQKVEQIDDDPLVEAPKPKIEGFNISPKVLGHQPATLSFVSKVDGSDKGSPEADTYDEVARKCLTTPSKQIDDRLLKELEKLGVPQPGTRAVKEPILENELVQMDVLKKPRKPVKKTEIDLETREYKREPPECYKLERIDPTNRSQSNTSLDTNVEQTAKLERLVEHFEKNLVNLDQIYTKTAELLKTTCLQQTSNSSNQSYTNLTSEPRPPFDPNRVLIDPFDKKTIAYDTGECDYRDMSNLLYYDYIKPENQVSSKEVPAIETSQSEHSDQAHPTRFRPILTKDDLRIVGQKYNQQYTPTDESYHYCTRNYDRLQKKRTETINNEDRISSIETETLMNADKKRETLNTDAEGVAQVANLAQGKVPSYSYHPAHVLYAHSPAMNRYGYMFNQPQYPYLAESSYYNAARGYNPSQAYYESRQAFQQQGQIYTPQAYQVHDAYKAYMPEAYKTGYAFAMNPANYTQNFSPNIYYKPAHANKPEHGDESKPTPEHTTKPERQTKYEDELLEEPEKEYNRQLGTTTDAEHESNEEVETIKLELCVGPEVIKDPAILSYEPTPLVEMRPKVALNVPVKEPENQERDDISLSFLQSKGMVNPMPNHEEHEEPPLHNMTDALDQLPKQKVANDSEVKMSLSELLRKVRERNRLELFRELNSLMFSSQSAEAEPVKGKCGKKPPPCPPPAPKCPPPDPCPPKPCPPPPPPCPKPCKPECPPPCPPPKSPCAKFNSIRDVITLLFVLEPQDNTPLVADLYLCQTSNGTPNSAAYLTEEVVIRLQNYAECLIAKCRVCKSENSFDRLKATVSVGFRYARDYTPWTPIPSWPIPKKEKKEAFVCPKEGCKLFPPPRSDPPCLEKPCPGFPRRTFSQVDFFTLYLAENQVYDIGD